MVGRRSKWGLYVYIQLIHIVIQQKLTQHCKAIILLKKKKKSSFIALPGRAHSRLMPSKLCVLLPGRIW